MKAPKITEAQWQGQVLQLAHTLGWKHLHVRRTIGKGNRWTTSTNVVGWPDLLLWADGRGFVALELKVRPNKATPAQLQVLDSLKAAGATVLVAYPDDLDTVAALLSRRPALETA